MKIIDYNYGIGKGFGAIRVLKEGVTDGEVITSHGIVSVYAQGDTDNPRMTTLSFVYKGRMYKRNFEGKRYSPRGIVTKAKQFAKAITEFLEEGV